MQVLSKLSMIVLLIHNHHKVTNTVRDHKNLWTDMTSVFFQERVRFHNTGPSSIPGAIVMSIEDGHKGTPSVSQIDPM